MALGYKNPQEAVGTHVDDEDKGMSEILTLGGKQNIPIINESGLYSLVLSSKLPTAKQFKRWVTAEVLPSIRKHGAYMTPETLEQAILNPDTIIKIATALTVDNQIMKPKAEYFNELVDHNLNTGIRETAKELGVKERSFVSFLLDRKYLYRDKKGKLQPYSQYADDLFVLKECYNDKTQWAGTQLLIIPKGRETFRLLYLKTA